MQQESICTFRNGSKSWMKAKSTRSVSRRSGAGGIHALEEMSIRSSTMYRRVIGLLSIVFLASCAITAQAPDTSLHAVSYVDVVPASRGPAVAAFKQYRDSSRKDEGYVRLELFEQIGRPGHFAILETWRDQKAWDAHGMAAHTQHLMSALQPIRSSGYDQRPYKTVTVNAAPAA